MKKFWEIVRGVCSVVGVLFIGYFFLVGFFCGPSVAEPYDRHKMSQVAVPPQKPIWQKRQRENPLPGITENLLRGLATMPKPPQADGKLQPFEFYGQWRARQPCPPQ